MKKTTILLLAVVLGASATALLAADWNSQLEGGGIVTVDPDTQRATVTRDGVTAPLWNGVHRMQDGSALIINQGEAVAGMPATRAPRQLEAPDTEDWEGALIAGFSPCEQLTQRVCGPHDECAAAAACSPAQQLLTMEREERSQAADGSRMTFTSGQCIKAGKDVQFFTACNAK